MPWTCIDARGRLLTAPDMNESEWRALRQGYRDRGLTMTCCGAAAIPRTSTKGNSYFAHAPGVGDCNWDRDPSETSERHQDLQLMLRRIVRGLGWSCEIEVPGRTPDGERWRADVLAERGGARAALEVQLASQTAQETVRRTRRYAASGVACLWLLDTIPGDLNLVRASRIQDGAQTVAYPLAWPTPQIERLVEVFLGSVIRLHEEAEAARRVHEEFEEDIRREQLEILPLFVARLAELRAMCERDGFEIEDFDELAPYRAEDMDGWMWEVRFNVYDRGGDELEFDLRRHHNLASWGLCLGGSPYPRHFGDGQPVPSYLIQNAFHDLRRGDM